jgi:tetratricopeptide (TPR) repeat protein
VPIATTLNLAVADYKDANHWYWRLTGADGHFLADQEVRLDTTDSEYEGFLDLPAYLAMHAAPDRRREDEARLVRQVGEWMGRHFYGAIGDKILDAGTPAIVHVQIPAQPTEAAGLLYRPWELGYVQGQPLAVQDVSLIFEVQGESAAVKRVPVGERLRILAVFSLPVDASALNLRQERYELSRTIRTIGQHNRAIDLRVLQYGVTRDALREVLEEGEGWDIVHFSGHGLAAHLVLEKADGTLDLVPSNELAKLLRPARGRLKWVTLSACLSAAATVEETLRWLGLEPHRASAPVGGARNLQTVARALVQSLDCAVLAMRYPVGDQFAIDLGRCLFEGVLEKKQSLARALQVTLPKLTNAPDVEAVAVATPTLFGRHAAKLAVTAPEGEAPVRRGISYLPLEPERFVGRVGLLTQARATMAPGSGHTGVLFHGMSGGGKTACALELAWQYAEVDRFRHFVWFKAPPEGHDIAGALSSFASQWDIQLDQLEVSLVAIANSDEATFTANLPRLTSFLAQRSVLMVLDNLESLLRENGNWRDARWEKLIGALLDHRGQSRLVLTSRVRPQPLHPRVLALPVHSLTLEEAALLARQSRNLGRLLRDPAHRPLVVRTLKLVQGHPELLRLAEAQASSPERLTAHLDAAEQAATAGAAQLEAFFRTGESALDAGEFLGALYAWTKSVSGALPEPARILFHRLCSMEEEDREKSIIEENWGDVASATRDLVEAGLVDSAYHIHPGVAEAGREQAGPELRESVDVRLATYWVAVFRHALGKEGVGMGELILRSGRNAVPYLMRQRQWNDAARLLEQVIKRDKSPATLAGTVPLLQRIAEETEGTLEGIACAGVLAKTLSRAGRAGEAVAMLGKLEQQAVESGQHRVASAVTGELVNLLLDAGHLAEALTMVERKKDHTRRAGLGPWTQLSDEGQRLQILNVVGHHEEVLAAVEARREEMKGLPESHGSNETVEPWQVKEALLSAGGEAALRLRRWQEALSLNEEVIQTKVGRGATSLEVARTRHNDYGPLLKLQRYGEARRLLHQCLAVFESEGDTEALGSVHSAIANLESQLQHFQEAVRHESTALRLEYSAFLPQTCAMSHFNLANYLIRTNADARLALAHRLASVLISYQTNDGELPGGLNTVRKHLALVSPSDPPASFDELCRLVEQTEGVRFRDLFSRLPQRAASGDEALRTVLEMARSPEPPE